MAPADKGFLQDNTLTELSDLLSTRCRMTNLRSYRSRLDESVAVCRSGSHENETAAYPRGKSCVAERILFYFRSDAEAGRRKFNKRM